MRIRSLSLLIMYSLAYAGSACHTNQLKGDKKESSKTPSQDPPVATSEIGSPPPNDDQQSQGGNDNPLDGVDDGSDGNLTASEVSRRRKQCGTSAELVMDAPLPFPSTVGKLCEWGVNGNLPAASGSHCAAVNKQPETIKLPQGAVLCSIELEGGSTSVRFDDFIFFTFEDQILAAGTYRAADFQKMGMLEKNGIFTYDKSKIIGSKPYDSSMNDRSSSLCPSDGSCSIFRSDANGPLFIRAPKAWFDRLPPEKLTKQVFEFAVHVTGQAHNTDCQHSGMNFTAKVHYVK